MPLKFNEPNSEDIVGLYIITPTYPRPEQLPELTRLSQTLMVNINKYILHRNFDEKNWFAVFFTSETWVKKNANQIFQMTFSV